MKNVNKYLILVVATFGWILGCGESQSPDDEKVLLLTPYDRFEESSTAGNLVATAMREVHDLDVVLYPSALLLDNQFGLLSEDIESRDVDRVLSVYPDGNYDQFRLGTMKGSDLKEFISSRVREKYTSELQVAGLRYDIRFVGGIETVNNISLKYGKQVEEDAYYRVAISNFFYFSGATFPSYKYRDNLTSRFRREGKVISAKESLAQYLQETELLPDLESNRSRVVKTVVGDMGELPIYEIQGENHLSPYYGYTVKTSGIVTAVGILDWYPGGTDIYIQSEEDDDNPLTSNALHIYLDYETADIQIGDKIEVQGVIWEEVMESGIGRTGIRDVTQIDVISNNNDLPEPVKIGPELDREIPSRVISSFRGYLNTKPQLDLNDGIDFWESLEGMRLQISSPRVVGFRGGSTEFESRSPKPYLNLYVVPGGAGEAETTTLNGGIIIDQEANDFNPEIMNIITHHLTNGVDETKVFNVGDVISGDVVGVLGYEKNIFGGGDFAFLVPEQQESLDSFEKKRTTSLSSKPQTKLTSIRDHLTVATYNVENLAGNQWARIKEIGKSIRMSLKCPDIVNLVEIQDNNGVDFDDDAAAELTLSRLIDATNCKEADYGYVNINPVSHNEGGEPGGNIRVAMIFNRNRVEFTPRRLPDPLAETVITENGDLSYNPGRVYPTDPVFIGSRKSIVAQFKFNGEDVFIIGNHLKSKLGDDNFWGNKQPPVLNSQWRRAQMAARINNFVKLILKRRPDANVIVLGDFNDFHTSIPMKAMEGDELVNLISYGDLVPFNDRYTYNYNGNSQSLDHIFVSPNLLTKEPEVEILHINTDFMARVADHDPVIARFKFKKSRLVIY